MKYMYAQHDNNDLDNIKFLELNAGPEYEFELKTACLNTVLFMTICLGCQFPLLYMIALLAIVLQYIVERYTLAVFYRLPAKFSLELTELNPTLLNYAPLIGTALAFWSLGNH